MVSDPLRRRPSGMIGAMRDLGEIERQIPDNEAE
jgi:hypothetical protein